MNIFGSLMANSFINQYGTYALQYTYLNALGSPSLKAQIPLIGFFVLFVLSIIVMIASAPKAAPGTPPEQIPERSGFQKFILYFGLLLLFAGFGSLGYYGFIYVFKYLPEKAEWLTSLPPAGKMAAMNLHNMTQNR